MENQMLPAEEVVFLMKRLNELFGQVLAENDDLKEKNEELYELGLNENTARFEDMLKIERLEDKIAEQDKGYIELDLECRELRTKVDDLTEELQAWKEGDKTKLAFHQHIVENEKRLTKLGTASKLIKKAKDTFLSVNCSMDERDWYLDVLDLIYEEVTGEKYSEVG